MLTPQQLLTKIHEMGIFVEDWDNFPTKKARIEKIRLYREQLRQINRQLKEAEDTIKATFDGRNQTQAILERLNLLPYSLIRDLIENVGIGLKKIEIDENLSLPQYGDTIYGDLEDGYWAIGDTITAQKWLIKHRANKVKTNLAYSQTQLQKNQKIVKSRIELYFSMFFAMIAVIIAIIGFRESNVQTTSPLTTFLVISAFAIWLGLFTYWLNRHNMAKKQITFLEHQIVIQKSELEKLKLDFQKLR